MISSLYILVFCTFELALAADLHSTCITSLELQLGCWSTEQK